MKVISQHNPVHTSALGDRINVLLYAHQLSVIENALVNILQPLNNCSSLFQLFNFGRVTINAVDEFSESEVYNTVGDFLDQSEKFGPIPLQKNISARNIKLPKKYLTTQWDAVQPIRQIDGDRIKKIHQWYEDQGYELISVGGKGTFRDLEDIIYVMANSSGHVGADSGMMHVAKMLMPPENIHIYVNLTKKKINPGMDLCWPDGWNVQWNAREMFRRGAKMNFAESPSEDEIEYFKDTSIFRTNYWYGK